LAKTPCFRSLPRSNPHPIREPADVVQILRLAA
jgi:hypothetical protein